MRAFTALLAVACGGVDPTEAATACEQECPIGTTFDSYVAVREGFELGVGASAGEYDGGIAYRHFGEGECRWDCVTTFPCGAGLFPVITATCFTCADVLEDGTVSQGAYSEDTGP